MSTIRSTSCIKNNSMTFMPPRPKLNSTFSPMSHVNASALRTTSTLHTSQLLLIFVNTVSLVFLSRCRALSKVLGKLLEGLCLIHDKDATLQRSVQPLATSLNNLPLGFCAACFRPTQTADPSNIWQQMLFSPLLSGVHAARVCFFYPIALVFPWFPRSGSGHLLTNSQAPQCICVSYTLALG